MYSYCGDYFKIKPDHLKKSVAPVLSFKHARQRLSLKLMDRPWLALLEAGKPPYCSSSGDGLTIRKVLSFFISCQNFVLLWLLLVSKQRSYQVYVCSCFMLVCMTLQVVDGARYISSTRHIKIILDIDKSPSLPWIHETEKCSCQCLVKA